MNNYNKKSLPIAIPVAKILIGIILKCCTFVIGSVSCAMEEMPVETARTGDFGPWVPVVLLIVASLGLGISLFFLNLRMRPDDEEEEEDEEEDEEKEKPRKMQRKGARNTDKH